MALKEFFSAFFIVQEVMQELYHVVENKFMVVHSRETLMGLYVIALLQTGVIENLLSLNNIILGQERQMLLMNFVDQNIKLVDRIDLQTFF